MKKIHFNAILLCFCITALSVGCERTELQKTSNNQRISTREIDDCDECPNEDDCCCGIELLSTAQVTLKLCGTSDGAGTCSNYTPESPCITIGGGGQQKTIDPSDPKYGFCMVEGNSFSIKNIGVNTAYISVTCQHDLINAQTVYVTIGVQETYYFGTNNSCEVGECEP